MSVKIMECLGGGWLYVITDAMGELVHSEGVFNTADEAVTASNDRLATL